LHSRAGVNSAVSLRSWWTKKCRCPMGDVPMVGITVFEFHSVFLHSFVAPVKAYAKDSQNAVTLGQNAKVQPELSVCDNWLR